MSAPTSALLSDRMYIALASHLDSTARSLAAPGAVVRLFKVQSAGLVVYSAVHRS